MAASAKVVEPPRLKLDAAEARRFLSTWIEAQNTANFERYARLYGPSFTGTKRADGKVTHFDRSQWLVERKAMFERNPTVTVSDVQTFEHGGRIELVFEQRWVTGTFADVGTKVLVLERAPEGYRIQREEMLDSNPDKKAMGPCAKAYEAIEAPSKSVRFFADLGSRETSGPHAPAYAEVSSQEDANGRAVDGYAWEFWVVAKDGPWLAAKMYLTSPSGDWIRYTDLCFRGDGSLAELKDSYRTFHSEGGVVNATIMLAFSAEGTVIGRTHDARLLETGKPAKPHPHMLSDPHVVMNTSQLPFKLTD